MSDLAPITTYADLGVVGFDAGLDPRTDRNNLEVESQPVDPASVFYLLHLSDFQIPDAQTPAFTQTNMYALNVGGMALGLGSFRPQSPYLPRSADGMVRTANRLAAETRSYDLAVHTGDSCENAQDNEQDWFFAVMNGGRIDPNTGDAPPMVPGGESDPLDAFATEGLVAGVPWIASIGNHDLLAQGNFPQALIDYVNTPGLTHDMQRFFGEKGIALPPHSTADRRHNQLTEDQILGVAAPGVVPALNAELDLDVVLSAFDFRDAFEAYYDGGALNPRPTTPNAARRAHDRCGFIERFFDARHDGSGPAGHGFSTGANGPIPGNGGCPGWYVHVPADNPVLRFVNLDLNFEYGFSQGMISRPQLPYDYETLTPVDEALSREFSTAGGTLLVRPGTPDALFLVPALQGAPDDALRGVPAFDQIAFIEQQIAQVEQNDQLAVFMSHQPSGSLMEQNFLRIGFAAEICEPYIENELELVTKCGIEEPVDGPQAKGNVTVLDFFATLMGASDYASLTQDDLDAREEGDPDGFREDLEAFNLLFTLRSILPDPIDPLDTDEFREMLAASPNVILHLDGHSHFNKITGVCSNGRIIANSLDTADPSAGGSELRPCSDVGGEPGRGYYEIQTASTVDWPFDARIVELVDNNDGTLTVYGTVFEPPVGLDELLDTGRRLALGNLEVMGQDVNLDRPGDVNVALSVRIPDQVDRRLDAVATRSATIETVVHLDAR